MTRWYDPFSISFNNVLFIIITKFLCFSAQVEIPPPPHPLIGETTPKEVAVDHPLTDPGVSEKITSEKVVG